MLIEGFAAARKVCPQAFLLLVGGSAVQVEKYRKIAAEAGIPEADVTFTGRVDQATAKAYMAQAAILTSPRSAGTNTPLKIYELLASGIPLLATRILSHTQVLDDEVCFMVEPTAVSMAEGLVAALSDEGRRAEVVEAARALYRDKYSRPVYEAKMRRLFEIVGRCRPARQPSPQPQANPVGR
jgi:glycosyltransferase involved in cell wall biosynthesis